MKMTLVRMSCIAAALLAPVTFTTKASNEPSPQAHSPRLMAVVTMFDGATRTVQLEGVGCSQSICSRTVVKGGADSLAGGSLDALGRRTIALDSIAAIKDTTQADALFVLKDGTGRRMHLITDFRVLYLVNRSGDLEKLDLAKVKSVEFAPAR
jgi:hypothetical protein